MTTLSNLKKQLRKIPVIGPVGDNLASSFRQASRRIRGKTKAQQYSFQRIELDNSDSEFNDRSIKQIVNLLNYTKTSDTVYNAGKFPAGYHNLQINGVKLSGQREPSERIKLSAYDFSGKTVLDIGCNQGGMLFSLQGTIAHGVGIDFDSRLVNAATKIRSLNNSENLDFFVFNLEDEDLNLIKDFLPDNKVDITFLLSVCMWIENWKEVINLTREISHHLLFESNGKTEQQEEQIAYLRTVYKNVVQLSAKSEDDKSQKNRMLFLCS